MQQVLEEQSTARALETLTNFYAHLCRFVHVRSIILNSQANVHS